MTGLETLVSTLETQRMRDGGLFKHEETGHVTRSGYAITRLAPGSGGATCYSNPFSLFAPSWYRYWADMPCEGAVR